MRVLRLAGLVAFLGLACMTARAQWINGQNADLVLGQKDFTGNTPGLAADSLSYPTGVATDPTSGKLFVADISNDRVLRWGSAASLVSGEPAEAVFGQPDFTTNGERVTQDGMDFPTDVVVDTDGHLYVADALNNRVLRFDSASWKPSGANADGVLGQPDFTSKTKAVTRSGMEYVRGLAVDDAGRLWVSDQRNHRVLRFDGAASKPNGADADGVLGQADFVSKVADTSQSGMAHPRGVWVDEASRLWVAVTFINRVMRFDDAAGKPNGANADAVLGQPDFTSSAAETSATGMHQPSGIAMDQSGRLYVGDFNNNRVTWFNNAASKANGAAADGVLGQSDFTSATATTTQNGMNSPWGLTVDRANNTLWVCDDRNQRVLRFTASSPLPVEPESGQRPARFALRQNYPNPFNPSTRIRYEMAERGHVSLKVYNVLGEEVVTLVDETVDAGYRTVQFDAAGLSSGVYYYRLRTGQHSETKMMLLTR
ncbi:MAG: T9SS type A sorting domain-containing protein [Bacteroidota bacterium]